jgi:hypothetical protein
MTHGARPEIGRPACEKGMRGCTVQHADDDPEAGVYCEVLIGLYEIASGQLLRLTAGQVTTPSGEVIPSVVLTSVDGSAETEVGHMPPATAQRLAAGCVLAADVAAAERAVDRYAS